MTELVPERAEQTRTSLRGHGRGQAFRTGARSVCLYTCSADASGMGVHMVALARHMVEAGVRVSVAYWPAPATERLVSQAERFGAATARTPHPRDRAYGRELAGYLRETRPDVVHVHVGTGRENFGGVRAARAAGVPAVVETLHLPWMLRSRAKRQAFLDSLEGIHQLIVVSQAQGRTYERIGVPSSSLVTVPNGVVPGSRVVGRGAARERLGIRPDEPVLMTVGRLAVQKGHRYLVDALPPLVDRWPNLVAVVVGDGHLREQLEAQADALGVRRSLRLIGHRTDARELLNAADVFVLPSRHEGMPMAVLEAMDARLPVVATRVTGTDEVVEDGVTGRLVPPEDSPALASVLAELLADEGQRSRLAAAGWRLFHDRFTAARMTAETLAVYDRTLARLGSLEDARSAEGSR